MHQKNSASFKSLLRIYIDVQLVFKDNSTDAAGSVLYGGTIGNCKLIGLVSYNSGKVFNKLVHIENSNE